MVVGAFNELFKAPSSMSRRALQGLPKRIHRGWQGAEVYKGSVVIGSWEANTDREGLARG